VEQDLLLAECNEERAVDLILEVGLGSGVVSRAVRDLGVEARETGGGELGG
jgi:hypothetical protein